MRGPPPGNDPAAARAKPRSDPRGEQVAFTADGTDQRTTAMADQLGAQTRYGHVDSAIESLGLIAVDDAQQGFAADDLAGIGGQRVEQLELAASRMPASRCSMKISRAATACANISKARACTSSRSPTAWNCAS